MGAVRRVLDFLYTAAGVLAALCLITILSLIVLQMLARWTGEVFPGAPNYAGYAMAAASFFAFANALGIDAFINPRAVTISRILQHVRRGRIRGEVHQVGPDPLLHGRFGGQQAELDQAAYVRTGADLRRRRPWQYRRAALR